MKNPLQTLTALILLLLGKNCFAQPACGFDALHSKLLKENAAYRKKNETSEVNIRKYIAAHKDQLTARVSGTNATLYTIPVVVHVIHTGGAIGAFYNPSDAQIIDAIAFLNEVYNGSYPGTQGAGDLQIQFVLAKRDPDCNPTNGINRVNGSGVGDYAINGISDPIDPTLRSLSHWPSSDYYNIYLVNKIANPGIAGYASLPGAPDLNDGAIILSGIMKRGDYILPHEIGHAFDLYHTFEGSTDNITCPANTNCSIDGDQICDTDPVSLYVDCRTGINPCTNTSYSLNTESNYMSYTYCHTLFTPDQKARMLASAASTDRFSLTTSLSGTPTFDANNPCLPKINFEFTEDQQTEFTAEVSECRSYKDYTYNMVIGNNPSATATATLTISGGTAVEGTDYAITTNGSFTSPSKTISFPNGSHANQSFTIRIYDDVMVESTETLVLGFDVNNGGGNATKGTGRTNLTLTIVDNDAAPGTLRSTVSVGYTVGSLPSPLRGKNAKQKTQLLYRASELTDAGLKPGKIIGLSLIMQKSTETNFIYHGLTIKMGKTSVNTISPPVSDAAFTTVYSNDYSTVFGLNTFNFSTPFDWDGVSNVVVTFCYDNGSNTSPDNDYCNVYFGTGGSTGVSEVFQAGVNCDAAFSTYDLYSGDYKPLLQLVNIDAGPPPETSLNSSATQYLGPNTDLYFYDQSTSKLLARINNNSNFDYGCTQVFIDRNATSAGAVTMPFLNNNAANYLLSKTLKVVPTTNNPSGAYQISLYYTPEEINAWHAATGQTLNNIELVKVSSQIADVTPANPSGGTTITTVTPIIGTLGSSTVLTGSFTTGFSGFGAGVTGNAALPIALLDFKGQIQNHIVTLSWSTSSEINSKNFEVERSNNGVDFFKVGTINAAGNNNTIRYYSFVDPNKAIENNYYRLKQLDIDGKYDYSKIILIKDQASLSSFKVINNPFTNSFEINFGKPQTGKINIRLLDVAGKEIFKTIINIAGQTRTQINLAGKNISPGIYLLQVRTAQEQFVEKVIKQ